MTESRFRKLTPVRIFEQVVETVRRLILSGDLNPGDKLPTEQELEKQLNVSRSSIREALRVLEFEGLVEVRRGSGTYVAPYSHMAKRRIEVAKWLEQREETLDNLLQVRMSLEALTVSLAAGKITEDEKQELVKIFKETAEGTTHPNEDGEVDLDALVELDSRFHLAISRISGNDIAHEIVAYVIPAFHEANKAVIYVGGTLNNLLEDHGAILSAIQTHDSEAAESAMRKHIERVRREVSSIKERSIQGR